MLTAAAFRRVRLKVLKDELESHGFRRGQDNIYWRELSSGQVHSLKFASGGRVGNGFYLELGFTYSFLPPFAFPPGFFEKERFSPYKCCFYRRFGVEERRQWFDYCDGKDSAQAMLVDLSRRVLTIFGDVERRWSDARKFLNALPPDALDMDRRLEQQFYRTTHEAANAQAVKALEDSLHVPKVFPPDAGWNAEFTSLCVMLGFIALKLNRVKMARRYWRIGALRDPVSQRDALICLRAALR